MFIKKFSYLFFILSFFNTITPHGFSGNTLIKTENGNYKPLEEIVDLIDHCKKQYVMSYDKEHGPWLNKKVKAAGFSQTDYYCHIEFNDKSNQYLDCTPSQPFYRLQDGQWVSAHMLAIGDRLLSAKNNIMRVSNVSIINEPLTVYTLEIKDTHTFFVTEWDIITHNMFIPIAACIGFTLPFDIGCGTGGSLGCAFGPIGFCGGIIIGGVIGTVINACIKNRVIEYDISFEPYEVTTGIHYTKQQSTEKNQDTTEGKNTGAQAPGKPTENDGFIPKKNWDGKKINHRRGYGWLDKNGSIWIPTGPKGHGGPHWDVQHPNGDYDNVVPGGGIRGKK